MTSEQDRRRFYKAPLKSKGRLIFMIFPDMIPPSTKRVTRNTSENVNKQIRQETLNHLNVFQGADSQEITRRLQRLNREWDTERALETSAASVVLLSILLGVKKSCWLVLAGTASFFLLQHAILGWCPPLPVIRSKGIRTPDEIYNEKTVLKFLRGDYADAGDNPEEILQAAEK